MRTPSGANPVGFWCTSNNVVVPFKGSQLVLFMNARNCPSGVFWNETVTAVARVAFSAGAGSSGASVVVPSTSAKPDTPGPGSAEAGSPNNPRNSSGCKKRAVSFDEREGMIVNGEADCWKGSRIDESKAIGFVAFYSILWIRPFNLKGIL